MAVPVLQITALVLDGLLSNGATFGISWYLQQQSRSPDHLEPSCNSQQALCVGGEQKGGGGHIAVGGTLARQSMGSSGGEPLHCGARRPHCALLLD